MKKKTDNPKPNYQVDKAVLPLGKLNFSLLGKLLEKYQNNSNSRVIIGPKIGEDAAVKGYKKDFIKRCQEFIYKPGLSVVEDALLANKIGVHVMHDPTEGGIASGLFEIALASQVGLMIEEEKINILEESKILCNEYNLDPLKTIASGALLIIAPVNNASSIINILNSKRIKASLIGEVKEENYGVKILTGDKLCDLKFSAKDEITKIFK